MIGREGQRDPRYPGPTWRDWVLVAISLTFAVLGFFMARAEPKKGLAVLAFFGGCAAVGIWNVARKLRFTRLRPRSVEVVAGVPLRPSRVQMALLGGGMLGVGLAMLPAAIAGPIIIQVCVIVMIAAGAFVVVAVLLGKLPVGFLQFDEGGLTVGRRSGTSTIGWDNIQAVWPGELNDNAVLLLSVRDLGAVVVHPPEATREAIRGMLSTNAWLGAHVMVMAENYGIDLPLLVAAIERYAGDPASRAGLSVPRLSPSSKRA